MRKHVIWPAVTFIVSFWLFWGSLCYGEAIKPDVGSPVMDPSFTQQKEENLKLQEACLAATITAIQLEMDRYKRWIDVRKQQGDQKGLANLEESLAALKADLDKYVAMDARDYVLPEAMRTIAWVESEAGKDSIVYVEGMSKSGPWYHLAGIQDGDYAKLRPGTKYGLNIYAVYQRTYGSMKSAYVFVDVPQLQRQGKRIAGSVFERKNAIVSDDIVKCDTYKMFLVKDLKPGSKGELLLDAKQSSFDLTLSDNQLKEYLYIEVVSPYGSKVLKIDEIKEGTVTIILDRDVVLKKPAIYLYPLVKTKVDVTHHFKGTLLNTYPAYADNWTVIAEPNGSLFNVRDGRMYKYLFWDGVYSFSNEHYKYNSGFYVQREDYVSFLQAKLQCIGLNGDEINDFIVYWLPAMSRYQNCFVHFRINDNIDGSSVLETSPKAETMIRVFMEFIGIDRISEDAKLPEQTLPTFVRKGFTLVEWGGAEIGHSKIE